MSDRPADRLTDPSKDKPGHREVTLLIGEKLGHKADRGLKTKDQRDHPRNDQRKNLALRILQVIRINCW